jgi:YD repeat-containing protein
VVGGDSYRYDANGNLQSGGGRTYAWTADNQPVSITSEGVQETYAYDADGQRVKRTRGTTTIVYLGGGVVEEETSGGTRTLYQFGGQVIAQRSTAEGVLYFHSDHLGSVSVVTSASGSVVSSQEFTPWGEVCSGGVDETSVSFTCAILTELASALHR